MRTSDKLYYSELISGTYTPDPIAVAEDHQK
jgi:hypothetical protein